MSRTGTHPASVVVGAAVVEARGVVVATMLAALVLIALLGLAVHRFSPAAIQEQACQAGQLPASECS